MNKKLDYILQTIQLYSYKLPTVKIGNAIMDFREKVFTHLRVNKNISHRSFHKQFEQMLAEKYGLSSDEIAERIEWYVK